MKFGKLLKIGGLIGITMGLIVGCAGTAKQDDAPAPQAEQQPAEAQPQQQTETAMSSAASQYEVVRGDNLWNIAGKSEIYGNPYQWPLIYKNNSAKIKDADLIYPGQNFDIENNPSAGDVDAAVKHAKSRGSWSIGAVEQSDKDYLSR